MAKIHFLIAVKKEIESPNLTPEKSEIPNPDESIKEESKEMIVKTTTTESGVPYYIATAPTPAIKTTISSVKIKEKRTHSCPICGFIGKSKIELNKHLNKTHHLGTVLNKMLIIITIFGHNHFKRNMYHLKIVFFFQEKKSAELTVLRKDYFGNAKC